VIFFFLCNSICVCSRCMMSIAHGCALVVSGVMIHGRIYMTERNIYFRANIVGIVTKVSTPRIMIGLAKNQGTDSVRT
jgi:hypothetical protein